MEQLALRYKNISLKGNVKDPLINIKSNYPILIMPSEYGEGLSRTILEAFSLKIPIICSKTALSGIFNKKHLFCAESNTTDEYCLLVDKIINKYREKKLLKQLDFGFNNVVKNFTETEIVNKTINLYGMLLKNNNTYLINDKRSGEFFGSPNKLFIQT